MFFGRARRACSPRRGRDVAVFDRRSQNAIKTCCGAGASPASGMGRLSPFSRREDEGEESAFKTEYQAA